MDDSELVKKCIKGNKQCWDDFVDKYSRLIYAYIYAILKYKGTQYTQENIHDIFQDVFLSLVEDNFKRLKSFKAKNNCNFASWLRQVATNTAIDHLRSIKTQVSIDWAEADDSCLKELLNDGRLSVVDNISYKERLIHLEDCIEQLGVQDQYFLELHLNQGLTLDQVKEHLKQSRGAVDMRKSRIVERLKDCFKHKGLIFSKKTNVI